jgi:hypothetical protein
MGKLNRNKWIHKEIKIRIRITIQITILNKLHSNILNLQRATLNNQIAIKVKLNQEIIQILKVYK